MFQCEVFVLKFLAIDGFAASAIVVCEVTPLTHLMAAVKDLYKCGETLHYTTGKNKSICVHVHPHSTHLHTNVMKNCNSTHVHSHTLTKTYTIILLHPLRYTILHFSGTHTCTFHKL